MCILRLPSKIETYGLWPLVFEAIDDVWSLDPSSKNTSKKKNSIIHSKPLLSLEEIISLAAA